MVTESFNCFADGLKAPRDVWILGTQALEDLFRSFKAVELQAIKRGMPLPYLFANYNVCALFPHTTEPNVLIELYNLLIDGINDRKNPH